MSFALCPYVQRSVITLLHKQVRFQVTYIDLAHKPDWFLALSPTGKVPALRVNDETALFESAVINEYIDETTLPRLHPEDPLERARHRAWIEYGAALLAEQFAMMTAQSEEGLAAIEARFFTNLARLEGVVATPFFRGRRFSLVDAAYAPLFMRLEILHAWRPMPRWDEFAKLRTWSRALMELPAVRDSVPADFREQLRMYLRDKGSVLVK
ncbi:MAG: glutathione S-transferase family protein [Pseudomonadota bacterium]